MEYWYAALVKSLTSAYQRMCDTHLLLAKAILAEGKYEDARRLIESTLPYISDVPQDRAALLSVLVKSWVGEKYFILPII